MVIWIIGLSGSGKTTLGKEVYKQLKEKDSATVFIDGDEIREIFKYDQSDAAYTIKGRKKNADRICELCAWLDRQNINVVCCILSIFEESRIWNKKTFSSYFEIFIEADINYLIENRDYKLIYQKAKKGLMKNVVGIDIPFQKPDNPNLVLDCKTAKENISKVAKEIITRVNFK